jgi:23S rRNA pseudouridine2605 synthase
MQRPNNGNKDHEDSESGEPASARVRLQKFLAAAGLGSRRSCEEYILTGRVTIDGDVVTELGTTVDPDQQKVHVDGEEIRSQKKRYYLLNKPPGYVCTTRDPAGRPRALDLVGDDRARLFTVGRLDENSRGLLLVTNDGELANRLAHPRYGVRRTYEVQVAGNPTREILEQLKKGMHFAEGYFRVRDVRRIGTRGKSTFLELTLTEGQNREIRRLLARIGHKVIDLQRVGFGTLRLGKLAEGCYRPLRPSEIEELQDLASGKRRPSSGRKKVAGKSSRRATHSRGSDRSSSKRSSPRRPGKRGARTRRG